MALRTMERSIAGKFDKYKLLILRPTKLGCAFLDTVEFRVAAVSKPAARMGVQNGTFLL